MKTYKDAELMVWGFKNGDDIRVKRMFEKQGKLQNEIWRVQSWNNDWRKKKEKLADQLGKRVEASDEANSQLDGGKELFPEQVFNIIKQKNYSFKW